jgi:hypothetical protein
MTDTFGSNINYDEVNEILDTLNNIPWNLYDTRSVRRRLDFSNITITHSFGIPIGMPVFVPNGTPVDHNDNNNIPLVQGILIEDQ